MRLVARSARPLLAALSLPVLVACAAATAPREEPPATTPEGDVLMPETYLLRAEGAWDGAPSLGGVWVAHPEVDEPSRVRIALADGSRAVTGALFRREREGDGPEILVSSEAAAALDLPANEAAVLEVVALRPPASEPPASEPPDDEGDP